MNVSQTSSFFVIMGGSIFFFVESKTFKFSVEEGGTFYMLCMYERNRDSLRSVFLGKKSAKRLLAIVEDLMSNVTPGNFACTFRDGDKVFILQMGSNTYGSFLMISELVHGRQKGFIVVSERKLGSGWRGFGFHLWKAIAPESLAAKLLSKSVLKPSIVEQFRQKNSKSFLLATTKGDWSAGGGGKKGKQLIPNLENSNYTILSNQNHDLCDSNAANERAMLGAKSRLKLRALFATALILNGCGLCPMEVSTRHVELWTRVHSWTRIRIRTCPVETSTGYKSDPFWNVAWMAIGELCCPRSRKWAMSK